MLPSFSVGADLLRRFCLAYPALLPLTGIVLTVGGKNKNFGLEFFCLFGGSKWRALQKRYMLVAAGVWISMIYSFP